MSLPPSDDNYIGEPQYPAPWTTKKPREGLRDSDEARIVSLAPDVCKSPTVPVPYPIVDFCGHDENYTPSVRFTSQKAMVLRSNTTHVHGDEPGVGKGIKSGTVGDISEPIGHAPQVRAEGSPVIRHLDRFWMNKRNTVGEAIFVRDTKSYEAPRDDDPVPGSLVMSDASPEPLIMGAQYAQTMTGTMTDTFPGTQTQTPSKPAVKPKAGRRRLWAKELVDALTGGKVTQRQIENLLAELDYYATTPGKGLSTDQMGVLGQAAGQIRGTALPVGDLEAAENIKQQAWDKVFAMAKAGAKTDQNVRVTAAAKKICFELPPGADEDEFRKQLKEQQDELNKLSPDEYLNRRNIFQQNGRLNDGTDRAKARREWRRNEEQLVRDRLLGQGWLPEEAATEAAQQVGELMKGLDATHALDWIAGGDGTISGLGGSTENQAIGRQWKNGNAAKLDEHAKEQKKNGKKKLDVELDIC
jgi:hypothetical protein